jgi:excisionase family DNA binding protein
MLLTPKQAAEKIGASVAIVYGLVADHAIACYRIGRRGKRGKIMLDEADLKAYLVSARIEVRVGNATPPQKPRKPTLQRIKFS